tara:strand:- start:510 stop:1076 length:567 start_codon:yes stop_codon:yes gene_type:complete
MQTIDFERNVVKHIKGSKPAPVHLWNPPFCGDLEIHIDANGRWFYQKSEIKRERLIKLFANILKKENDKYFLVTPVEKVGITVEDVPFIATEIDLITKGKITLFKFRTNVGDSTFLKEHNQFDILFKKPSDEPQPYVNVRSNLFAKIDRKSFYRLVDSCTEASHKGENWLGFHSNNIFFPLVKSKKLD